MKDGIWVHKTLLKINSRSSARNEVKSFEWQILERKKKEKMKKKEGEKKETERKTTINETNKLNVNKMDDKTTQVEYGYNESEQ